MSTILEYKCPCCDGAISFDSSLQKMKCPYCDTEFEMETLRSYDESLKNEGDKLEWEKSTGSQWSDGDGDGVNVYSCTSCGGEIIGDETLAATLCPYCSNPVVLMHQFKGELRPDYVIPFKLDKESAKEALTKHFKGKVLLPKVFKSENHIDEIKGIYVPFWLFNADVDADMRYRATRIRSWSDRDYIYTETRYYSVLRGGSLGFEQIPADGSTKMPDALMESIEPYDYSEAVDFQTAYLAGYLADKYDVSSDDTSERVNSRIKTSTEQSFASTVIGYTGVIPEGSSVRLSSSSVKYALLPVWLLNTTWRGEKYTFAMNGQTGKFVGDLPVDKGLAFKWFAGVSAAVAAIAFAISYIVAMM